jgi:hypothetical protein
VTLRNGLKLEVWTAERLLGLADNGLLGLPNFQRPYQWNSTQVRAFLATVLAGLPSGNLLTAGNRSMRLELRPLEGAPPVRFDSAKAQVLLDGQQRVTSLYQSMRGIGPEVYFLDFSMLMDDHADMAEVDAVVSIPARRAESEWMRRWQAGQMLVPIQALWDSSSFFSWWHASVSPAEQHRLSQFGEVFSERISPVRDYEIPVTNLGDDLEMTTVAQVFERMNRWGQQLDAFDLLVARVQNDDFDLREAWTEARDEYPALARVFGDSALPIVSAISLLERDDVRRQAVLSVPPHILRDSWGKAINAANDMANVMLQEGFRTPDLVPYEGILTTGTAARMIDVDLEQLRRYTWISAVTRRYESASNSRIRQDFLSLGGDVLPDHHSVGFPEFDELRMVTRRSSRALWSTVLAVLLRHEPADLYQGLDLTTPDAGGDELWELTSYSRGGGLTESKTRVPIRLRAVGQLFALKGSKNVLRREGLVATLRRAHESPTLFGVNVDQALDRQLMPDSSSILSGRWSPEDLVEYRTRRILDALQDLVWR